MAETVKKSRIVSEDDLEESLMQEFNMRLKNCMSQEDQEQETEEKEEHIYDNVKIIKGQVTTTAASDTIYDEVMPITSKEFLEIERQYYGGENGGLRLLIDVNGKDEGFDDDPLVQTTDLDVNVNNFSPPEKTDFDDHVYETIEDELIYENVQNVQKPNLTLPTTCLTDMSDAVVEDEEPIQDGKSVKDRMFLSTDDTSCLLFTQTVTSPMLTPSEENIDFLKGFRRQSSQNTLSDNTNSNSSPKFDDMDQATDKDLDRNEVDLEQNPTYDDVSEVDNVVVCNIVVDDSHCDLKEPEENVYQNLNVSPNLVEILPTSFDIKHQTQLFIDNEIYEVESDLRGQVKSENIYENIEDLAGVVITGDQQKAHCDETTVFECNGSLSTGNQDEDQLEIRNDDVEIVGEKIFEPESEKLVDAKLEVIGNEQNVTMNGKMEKVETNGVKYDAEANLDSDDEEYRMDDNPSQLVNALKTKYLHNATAEIVKTPSAEKYEIAQLKSVDIMKQISKFESKSPTKEEPNDCSTDSTETTETTYTETTTLETKATMQDKSLKKKKIKKSRSHEKENISVNNTNNETNSSLEENFYNVNVKSLCRSFGDLTKIGDEKYHNEKNTRDKSSFNKFDALQKKNVLHVRSSDSSKAQEKFNGSASIDSTNCKACGKVVFQMEQMKAEKSIWHKNCFRCTECSKQLTVDTYESNEGSLYCKPHFKALFAPKVIEDDIPPSDKPDLGLEELHSLNVRERFQVFENYEGNVNNTYNEDKTPSPVNVKRSPSILSKLARFQAKGMDVGVTDDSLNGVPIEESSSGEEEEEEIEGEDADLVRARRAQKEKPFHFVQMSDVKSKWEHGEQHGKDERREERKQEIQSIRNKLFMGKQGKMKEAYQQAVLESETNVKKSEAAPVDVCDTRTLKEKFEKGQVYSEEKDKKETKETEDMSVFESGISKKSRSIFLELDANAAKAPQVSPVSPPKVSDVRKTKEVFLARQASDDVVKSSEQIDDVKIETSDIQQRFKFFETYKEPEKKRKEFRFTPPREGQVKSETPDREIYRDPDIVRSEEQVEDSIVAKESHTATKVLNKFRQMEENLNKEPLNLGPKPLKRFTPPPEPARPETASEDEGSETDDSEGCEQIDQSKYQDADLIEAQKAARARQLRAKFERWEASEIKREQQSVNIAEEIGEEQSQIESTKALRARFESLKETSSNDVNRGQRVKVHRFV